VRDKRRLMGEAGRHHNNDMAGFCDRKYCAKTVLEDAAPRNLNKSFGYLAAKSRTATGSNDNNPYISDAAPSKYLGSQNLVEN
jgi:hypothetical protein